MFTDRFGEARYRRYLEAFNAPDHETLHREFFAPDVVLVTLGNVLKGQQAIRDFYHFFHAHVREQIDLIQYYPSDGSFFVHVAMQLHAFEALTTEGLASIGITGMPGIAKNATFSNEMFIHYELDAQDRLKLLRCADYSPPRMPIG
jgi:hypothetical protein